MGRNNHSLLGFASGFPVLQPHPWRGRELAGRLRKVPEPAEEVEGGGGGNEKAEAHRGGAI